jgi:hypothetical protein
MVCGVLGGTISPSPGGRGDIFWELDLGPGTLGDGSRASASFLPRTLSCATSTGKHLLGLILCGAKCSAKLLLT